MLYKSRLLYKNFKRINENISIVIFHNSRIDISYFIIASYYDQFKYGINVNFISAICYDRFKDITI